MNEPLAPNMGSGLNDIRKSANMLMQLSWVDIVITADPPTGRCSNKSGQITEKKIIIDNVSGSVMPGQFLAIIGASGKVNQNNPIRRRKDHATQLPLGARDLPKSKQDGQDFA
jgi:hypothetical protein